MATTFQRETATIYQFPARGRFAMNAGLCDQRSAAVFAPSIVPVVSSSGWYHEEAVLEDERTRNH